MISWPQCFVIPAVCALLAWLLGLLAARLVFWPRTLVRVGFFRVQGLVPARQARLARSLGELVDQELFTPQDLARAMDSEEYRAMLRDAVHVGVDKLLESDSRWVAMLKTVLRGKARDSLKQGLASRLEDLSTQHAESAARTVTERLQLGERVRDYVAGMSAQELEAMLRPGMESDLRLLVLAMAGLGFALGWVQVLVLWIWPA